MGKHQMNTFQLRKHAENAAAKKFTWAQLEGFTKSEAKQMGTNTYNKAMRELSVNMLFGVGSDE